MNCIRISSVSGLFHEFYNPTPNGLSTTALNLDGNKLDATDFFWTLIFDAANIKHVIDKIVPSSPKYIAVISDVETFIKQVEIAKNFICNPDITAKDFFCYVETFSIVCKIYSEYAFNPHRLTIQNGFEINNFSASQIYFDCLDDQKNPYLNFIRQYVLPQVRKALAPIIFIDGAPTFYNMAICLLIKKEFPDVHICISRHSSEYYSLNKLESYLTQNKYLFKMVDSIILEYFDETEKQLLSALKNGRALSTVSNLIYRNKDKIYATPYAAKEKDYAPVFEVPYSTSKLINVHLQPYNICYWNKCTFCGINKKYHLNNNESTPDALDISLNYLKAYLCKEIKYVWFIDEAIHPQKLKYIADFLIQNNIDIIWQVRCRVEKLLLDKSLIERLQRSGLKELRLGLESASLDILKAMNKFNEDFSFEVVEEICSAYSDAGISIHFPMIIGFPGETSYERKKTYDYLRYLCEKYPLVSFNINVFNLDISSHIFRCLDKYEIQRVFYPCPLQDFLGNILQWDRGSDLEKQLFMERDQYMREMLYPWMPTDAFVRPHIFYRLSETARYTLRWKAHENSAISAINASAIDSQTEVFIPNTIVYGFDTKRNIYIIYNWQTHHYMIGNKHLIFIFDFFKTAHTISDAMDYLTLHDPNVYVPEDLNVLFLKLYQRGYLTEFKKKEEV
ncbi:MAG: hypothetical protein NC121_05540 [Blautia sp.]|nr:hypothetical protein [Blautia sp.]